MQVTTIFVLPTVEGLPPRALLGEAEVEDPEVPLEPDPEVGVSGVMAVWTADMGSWTVQGVPLPQELSEAITEHAKDLGIEW